MTVIPALGRWNLEDLKVKVIHPPLLRDFEVSIKLKMTMNYVGSPSPMVSRLP